MSNLKSPIVPMSACVACYNEGGGGCGCRLKKHADETTTNLDTGRIINRAEVPSYIKPKMACEACHGTSCGCRLGKYEASGTLLFNTKPGRLSFVTLPVGVGAHSCGDNADLPKADTTKFRA